VWCHNHTTLFFQKPILEKSVVSQPHDTFFQKALLEKSVV